MIVVRRAEPRDAASLVALADAVAAEDGSWLLTASAWRSPAEERRYLRAVRRHPDAAVFVAELDGVIVGRLSLSRDIHPSSRHVADLGLMVAAQHRRRGVGRRLLSEAVTWAGASGVTKIELHVLPWNEPAVRLYEAFGFKQEGVRRRHYLREGELVDALLMALHL